MSSPVRRSKNHWGEIFWMYMLIAQGPHFCPVRQFWNTLLHKLWPPFNHLAVPWLQKHSRNCCFYSVRDVDPRCLEIYSHIHNIQSALHRLSLPRLCSESVRARHWFQWWSCVLGTAVNRELQKQVEKWPEGLRRYPPTKGLPYWHFKFYILYFTFYILHFTFNIQHSKFGILHSTFVIWSCDINCIDTI